MYKNLLFYLLLCAGGALPFWAGAQTASECFQAPDEITNGDVFINYGSATEVISLKNRSSFTVGEPAVGPTISPTNQIYFGYWSRIFIPPISPNVTASQGELLDRIQVSWAPNPLSAQATQGFALYRNGVFLAQVGPNARNYNDFNVVAGRPYTYGVAGINGFGEGTPGTALGFQVPNGVATGWVQTLNGSPVPDAVVMLEPMQGYSLRCGPADGAYCLADSAANPLMPGLGEDWTIAFWIRTNSAATNAGLLRLSPFPLSIRAVASASGHEGIEAAILPGSPAILGGNFPDSTKNDWHHVAISYDGDSENGRLYIDGRLTSLGTLIPVPAADTLFVGALTGTGGWDGRLDELRIYHRQLDEVDLGEIMTATASSLTPGLSQYWKMDEEQGVRSFDLLKRQRLEFCGASFSPDRPLVHTAGKTNSDGYYRIEGVNYGDGTTFLAEPMKNFYMHRALRFVRDEMDYDTLPNFALPGKATLELWVNSAGPDGDQCLLSKAWYGNDFRLLLSPNGTSSDVKLLFNGTAATFGPLGMGFQHLALTIDSAGTSRTVKLYKNGVQLGATAVVSGVTGNWSAPGEPWIVGARRSGSITTDHFGGLIDEFAVYDTTLSAAAMQQHVAESRDMQEPGLLVYFPFDEGTGNRLNNAGGLLLPYGTSFGAAWTTFAAHQETEPHVFTPVSRQVTLNPSVTSVDQVDFLDRSTVAVSGFVRYKNTDCFAKQVEILVNGEPFNPRIYTDTTGKFTIDFDPGMTAILTPRFEDHQFVPPSWEVVNVTSPIAGILFNDVTTRTISGRVAGGDCQKSIISNPGTSQGTVCTVKIRTADGCLERQVTIDNTEGDYEFDNLPPLDKLTVAVVEHSDPDVKNFFQTVGGATVDLTTQDTAVDFTYYAPPQVRLVSGLDSVSPTCPIIVLDKGDLVTLNVKLVEHYPGGDCDIDTAQFRLINFFSEEVIDTAMSGGLLQYKFRVGPPNPSPPFLKTLQIIGKSLAGRESSLTREAVITGVRNKANTFTTLLPEIPTIILRDPPGDGSSAFIEQGQTICKTTTMESVIDVGGGLTVEVELAPSTIAVAAPLGVGTVVVTDPNVLLNTESTVTYQRISANSFETCASFSTVISTSDADLIVGSAQGGDVYVGEAINMIFGFADKVLFDAANCQAILDTIINVEPGDFATTFVYSEYNIQNNVLRYLDNFLAEPNLDPADSIRYQQSKARWQAILARNAMLRDTAQYEQNISFDAGVVYEYSASSDTASSSGVTNGYNTENTISTGYGLEIFGAGLNGEISLIFNTSGGTTDESGRETSIVTGYTLADDDPGDAFTVDVGMDSVYQTPVFRLKAGQSSCPWEPGTAHRDGTSLEFRDGSGPVATNVPANEAAVFKFTLGNASETNETRTYALTAGGDSNPHGAKIFLNGAPLDHNIGYQIPYGESVPITLTVERGPEEYDYDSLEIAFFTECEDDRANVLGLGSDEDAIAYQSHFISVHFIRPCSEVAINVPEQDWVVFPNPITPGSDDVRSITVSGYDTTNADFKLVRVQYRRSDGDGAWINIPGISDRYNPQWSGYAALPSPKPPKLQPGFTQYYWDTEGLSDGPYEIRAVAECSGAAQDKPGYSAIIKGRIERQPPSLVGTPQPSDGVYHVGDEISFTFNKAINCNHLIPADITQLNNVGLYDATTDQLIDIDVTCYQNKIIIDPNFQNEFFENRILRIELDSIEDLTGNTTGHLQWEFYVDRNELAWLTDSVGMTKYEEQTKTVTANIHNRGGYPVPFTIDDVPAWVHVVPDQGTLAPNEIRPISFTVDSSLAFGLWSDSITLHTETGQNPFFMGGDERLPFGVRVVCRPPDWDIDPLQYENSMNMVLELNIEGDVSTDAEDRVAAFIGDTVRGRATVQYVPQVDKYLAYLTIYGDPGDVLDPVRLEVWDASACLRYAVVEDHYVFQPDDVLGSPLAPEVVHTAGDVLRAVPLGAGWNWVSFNLAFEDPVLDSALATLNHPDNDLLKSQSAFALYFSGGGWFGTLNTLGNTSMYVYQADQADTLLMIGAAVDPANTPIPVVAGWNWIGYVPNYSLPVNDALSSLPAQTGDIIKSQLAFAQYINPQFGWIGNLKFMSPPNGYQIKLTTPGTLLYPPPVTSPNLQGPDAEDRGPGTPPPAASLWTVDPTQYENSMTLIGMLEADDANVTTATMELGAFVGSQVRGSTQALYIPPLDAYLFFLTVYANSSGEQLRYKLHDGATGAVQDLTEIMYFTPDLHQGAIDDPVPFTLPVSATSDVTAGAVPAFEVQPNPFRTETILRFTLPDAAEVRFTVTDLGGRQLDSWSTNGAAGLNTVLWRGADALGRPLPPGAYFVRLQTPRGSVVGKVVRQN